MKYNILVRCVIFILMSCNRSQKKIPSSVRTDGVYQSAVQTNRATGDKSISYLKFYEDGTVIDVSSSGTPEQIKKWFVKGNESVSEGHYTSVRNDISFISNGFGISVSYVGKIVSKDQLQMHAQSLNAESDVQYSFVRE